MQAVNFCHNVLLSVDLNDEASWQTALPVATQIADSCSARLTLITVIPGFNANVAQFFPEDHEQRMRDKATHELQQLVSRQLPAGREVVQIVTQGTIYHEIISTAETIGVDLIVMASHRPGLKDYLIGPNAARVVRHFPGSVLIVRNPSG